MLVKSAATTLVASVSTLALTSNANAFVHVPFVLAALWWGKAAVLTGAAFKAAAIGTVYAAKGIAFTKSGAAAMTVVGTALTAQAAPATIEFLNKIDYHVEEQGSKTLHTEIETLAKNGASYSVKFCVVDGKKIVVPNRYKICPEDSSVPQIGESFKYGG